MNCLAHRIRRCTTLSSFLFLALILFSSSACATTPEILFKNARVFTMNTQHPWAKNIALSQGRISGVDIDESDVDPSETEIIDLNGRFVMTGFHDAHLNAIDSGVDFLECPLYEVKDLTGLQEKMKSCSKKMKKGA